MKVTYDSSLGKKKTYYKWGTMAVFFPEYPHHFRLGVSAGKGFDALGATFEPVPVIDFYFGKRGIQLQFGVKGENK